MPRKTTESRFRSPLAAGASMRPRPDAAENGMTPAELSGAKEASMRPRPDAAENDALRTPGPAGDEARASMRPRPDAAENRADKIRPIPREWLQ